ncbi:MAG: MFS transporter [Desulfobacterales bacterium]|nr:MFS transporter [Desulfobacterales bacterium]MBS3755380.1 MFS transporter [Desulfobacterales bacterium]
MPVKWSLSSLYFIYFAILGIYLPYFNLYCYHLGFSGFEIGTISALRTLATAFFPLIWGAIADRFALRRPIFIFCHFTSTAIWAFYLLTTDFWFMFAITGFYGIFYAPLISFLESFSMDLLDTEKNRYGRLRAWGSISFIIMVTAVGRAIDAFSADIIIVLILCGSLIQSLLALNVPHTAGHRQQLSFSAGARTLLRRRVVIFLIAAFLMLASHGTYYGFFSIHLENIGFNSTFIGFAWALAVLAEIGIMVYSVPIFRRFSHEKVLIAAFVLTGIRWLVLAGSGAAWVILLTQLLHAFSYGAFHVASILYIDKLTPPETKTMGQAVNNAVTYGLGIMVGFMANGYFFDIIGAPALFAASGAMALLGGALMIFESATRPSED